MFISPSHSCLVLVATFCCHSLAAQPDRSAWSDDVPWPQDTLSDPVSLPDPYEPLIAALGGDSIRYCQGVPCSGRVEDLFPGGALKHSGYYGEGRLITYRNHYPEGPVEREFKLKDNTRCSMRIFFADGTVRSETHYVDGASRRFTEYYTNGRVRYMEEKHASLPCYMVMDLFAPDGTPVSTLHLMDKKHMVFEQKEYWPSGSLRASGCSQFNSNSYDTQRVGAWTWYDRTGAPKMEERYVDGKVHDTADL